MPGLVISNNHYIMKIGNEAYVIDTGSPISTSIGGASSLFGNVNSKLQMLIGNIDQLQSMIGMPINGLIGNDYLEKHVVELDFIKSQINLDQSIPPLANEIKLTRVNVLGQGDIFTFQIELCSKIVTAILDTGAPISYGEPPLTVGLKGVGQNIDWSPVVGQINTVKFLCPFKLGKLTGYIELAEAPALVQLEMSLVGAEAIIGPSIFEGVSKLVLDLGNNRISF